MQGTITLVRQLDSPEWNADVYGALSSISRVAASVRNKATVISLAYSLHKANKSLKALFDKVEASLSESSDSSDSPKAEDVTPERMRDTADHLMRLSRGIDTIHESLRRVGLTNNSLAAANLQRFYGYRQPLEDLADWIELATQPNEVAAIFDRGTGERKRGEVFDLKAL